jgi:hypothetical protein
MSKQTRQNQDRPVSELNAGQIVIRIETLRKKVQELEQSIGVTKLGAIGSRLERDFIKAQETKRKNLLNEINVLHRRFEQIQAGAYGI